MGYPIFALIPTHLSQIISHFYEPTHPPNRGISYVDDPLLDSYLILIMTLLYRSLIKFFFKVILDEAKYIKLHTVLLTETLISSETNSHSEPPPSKSEVISGKPVS